MGGKLLVQANLLQCMQQHLLKRLSGWHISINV